MQDTKAWLNLDDRTFVRRDTPCQHVHFMSASGKIAGDVCDVHVLSARIGATQRRKRRSMFADQCDAQWGIHVAGDWRTRQSNRPRQSACHFLSRDSTQMAPTVPVIGSTMPVM